MLDALRTQLREPFQTELLTIMALLTMLKQLTNVESKLRLILMMSSVSKLDISVLLVSKILHSTNMARVRQPNVIIH
jgi:hypothetical protein